MDETPKCHAPTPSVTNHSIIDSDTGMHIHMELNGIFSYFLTCQLTVNEMEYWERYPVVYLTPDSDWWDLNFSDFSEQETAMLDADGYIVDWSPNGRLMIMDNVNVDLSALYVEPPTWDQIKLVIGAVIAVT